MPPSLSSQHQPRVREIFLRLAISLRTKKQDLEMQKRTRSVFWKVILSQGGRRYQLERRPSEINNRMNPLSYRISLLSWGRHYQRRHTLINLSTYHQLIWSHQQKFSSKSKNLTATAHIWLLLIHLGPKEKNWLQRLYCVISVSKLVNNRGTNSICENKSSQ